jgi:hypothetical protein
MALDVTSILLVGAFDSPKSEINGRLEIRMVSGSMRGRPKKTLPHHEKNCSRSKFHF